VTNSRIIEGKTTATPVMKIVNNQPWYPINAIFTEKRNAPNIMKIAKQTMIIENPTAEI
jgi:hypothetical protein